MVSKVMGVACVDTLGWLFGMRLLDGNVAYVP